jgi:hypothetical protein
MDLERLIPENKDIWIISKNVIYIDYITKIPILMKRGDEVRVFIDLRIYKHIPKLLNHLVKLDIDFDLCSYRTFFENKFSYQELHEVNLTCFIDSIADSKFFDSLNKIDFDYTYYITKYLKKYECYDEFKEIYKDRCKTHLSKFYDWYSNKEVYHIKREDIRNYLSSLEREIKLNLLF